MVRIEKHWTIKNGYKVFEGDEQIGILQRHAGGWSSSKGEGSQVWTFTAWPNSSIPNFDVPYLEDAKTLLGIPLKEPVRNELERELRDAQSSRKF